MASEEEYKKAVDIVRNGAKSEEDFNQKCRALETLREKGNFTQAQISSLVGEAIDGSDLGWQSFLLYKAPGVKHEMASGALDPFINHLLIPKWHADPNGIIADSKTKNINGETPMHLAVGGGNPYLVEYLLTHGGKADTVNKNGKTLLQTVRKLHPDDQNKVKTLEEIVGMGSGQDQQFAYALFLQSKTSEVITQLLEDAKNGKFPEEKKPETPKPEETAPALSSPTPPAADPAVSDPTKISATPKDLKEALKQVLTDYLDPHQSWIDKNDPTKFVEKPNLQLNTSVAFQNAQMGLQVLRARNANGEASAQELIKLLDTSANKSEREKKIVALAEKAAAEPDKAKALDLLTKELTHGTSSDEKTKQELAKVLEERVSKIFDWQNKSTAPSTPTPPAADPVAPSVPEPPIVADPATSAPTKVSEPELRISKATLDRISSNDPALTELSLRYHHPDGLTIADLKALAAALETNTNLKSLDLGDNKIDDAGAMVMAKAKHHLKILNFSLSKIGDEGAKALAESDNTTLTTLDLGTSRITDAGKVWLEKIDAKLKKNLESEKSEHSASTETAPATTDPAKKGEDKSGQQTPPPGDDENKKLSPNLVGGGLGLAALVGGLLSGMDFFMALIMAVVVAVATKIGMEHFSKQKTADTFALNTLGTGTNPEDNQTAAYRQRDLGGLVTPGELKLPVQDVPLVPQQFQAGSTPANLVGTRRSV